MTAVLFNVASSIQANKWLRQLPLQVASTVFADRKRAKKT